MSFTVNVKLDNTIRDDIRTVSGYCGNNIDILFDFGEMQLLGYTKSTFCLCREIIDCSIQYNISIEPAVILSMLGYKEIQFNIDNKNIIISGSSNNKVGREVKVKLSSDPMSNYQADFYKDLCSNLYNGYKYDNIEQLSSFDRVSRINDKSESGVTISNNYFYTCGDMFKFFANTESKFNCFMLSDDLRSMIDFANKHTSTMYESGGYLVLKGKGECYFGIRVAEPQDDLQSLRIVMKSKELFSFTIDAVSLKSCMRPIKSSKVNAGKITFKPSSGLIIIGLQNVVYKLPFEYNDLSGDDISDMEFNFRQFNKLIQALTVTRNTQIKVYNRFISVMSTNDSIMLISRGVTC